MEGAREAPGTVFIGDVMKQIQLTQGKVAIVDDADYERLNKHKWYAKKGRCIWYAMRNGPRVNGKRQTIWMHREILGLKYGDKRQGDHRNHNGLANWRDNLRMCTSLQNKQNGNPSINGSSKYKGVYWHKRDHKWMARITVNGHRIYLGSFDSEIVAAHAYDAAAREYYGEFAMPNFGNESFISVP